MFSNTIKSLTVGYNPIGKSNVFSSNDCISGRVTLALVKECKVQSLSIKLKGKAEVHWTEGFGEDLEIFHSKEKYFSILQFIIKEDQGETIVGQGSHVYPFTFQIPSQALPSSYSSKYGKIVYSLEAILSRSKRLDSKGREEFSFIHKVNLDSDPMLSSPQHSIIDKKMRLFNSGSVGMDVKIEKTGFHQGERIKVVGSFQNNSTRDVRPKYCFYSKCSYFAAGKRKVETEEILKEEGEAIPPSAAQTVSRIFTIPPDTNVSILNCDILRVEYRLKIYLDVKYAFDPEVTFPIIILPECEAPAPEQSILPDSGCEAVSNP
ncbi:arrestin domain-containing protein 3-like [Gouania willdenowi]|uniref:Arrestin domain-containing protein 3-like n=1 Tax=Gouania willdenowi TaxID=441366 RepID=A0A8C5I8M8_GOUWI|nr:arrestin domain-containing protein 3-like [Gouania willdenowi]